MVQAFELLMAQTFEPVDGACSSCTVVVVLPSPCAVGGAEGKDEYHYKEDVSVEEKRGRGTP